MPVRKTIVCLANSTKLGAYCVAGVEQGSDKWIRPVGSGEHGAITIGDQTLADGSRPNLLDVIQIWLDGPRPQPGQPENWALMGKKWRREGHLDDDHARDLLEGLMTDEPVFGTNGRSISTEAVQGGWVTSSLAVVRPQRLTWKKSVGPISKIRCEFLHAGAMHDLPVTDPEWIAEFVDDKPGEYEHSDTQEVFLVVSLGDADPRYNRHWKLVAGVIGLTV